MLPADTIPACARACLLDIAAQLNGAMLGGFEQRNAARVMRALVRIGFADDSESDACQSVLADLRTIEREIPKDLLDGETISKGIVVTAFDCSPRLMLTIGDLVNTGSLPQLSERQPHQRAAGLCRGRQHPGAGELATEAERISPACATTRRC